MMVPRLTLCRSRWAFLLRRLPGIAWTCAAVLLLAAALIGAPASNATDEDARAAAHETDVESTPPQANLRVREGTEVVDQTGHFRISGGRVVFFTADGQRRLVGLENLNLERIARTVAETPQTLEWDVTGTITEYRGANFLLIQRAVLRSGRPSLGGSF